MRFGMPFSISIEPSTFCNLKCPHCPVGNGSLNRPKGNIDFSVFKNIIDDVYNFTINLFLYFQGEPFLNPQLCKMIGYAKSKGITTGLATNGHFIDKHKAEKIIKSGLDFIIISLDGTNQETYERYRKNGDFQTVIKNIKTLTKAKETLKSRTPFVEVQFIVFKHNQHQIKEIKQLCKQLNINKLSLKTAQVYNFEHDTEFIPNLNKFSRYKKINGKWQIKKKIKNRCKRLWFASVITWDGTIVPCCFDKNAEHAFGNIKNAKFTDIVKNEKFKAFAKRLLTNRKSIAICNNCTE